MPILYTIPSDGPSLTHYLRQQWLDKRQKNRLRTKKLQVGPYAHPEHNSKLRDFISIELMERIPSRPLACELNVFMPRTTVVIIKPLLYFLWYRINLQAH